MPRRDGFNVVELLVALGAVAGSVIGAVRGFDQYGVIGALAGVPIGFIVGGFLTLFLSVPLMLVLLVVLVVWAFLGGGREGVRRLFRETPTDSTTAGEGHGNG